MPPRRSHRATASQATTQHEDEDVRDGDEDVRDGDEDVTITGSRSPDRSQPSPSAAESFEPRSRSDHVKIMLATDNHIGYMEKDPVRGQDSINSFREILQLAKEREVDFILLGGDLFHENKPSRQTLHQVMGLLREYTLGDRPVSIELLSDPNDGRPEGYSFPAVNYEDANLNVAIPCFSIHGNHDDPQGVGVEGALSALDLLSVTGLINYFGKVELPSSDELASRGADRAPAAGGLSDVGIRIRPILLQKGKTKIALYGMGNIKDERMHFELRKNRVRMYRPREDPKDWFNILTIHQNRAAHDPKAVVPESMFDDSIHLVVWGHEHENRIVPEQISGKNYYISQPGSSVATSLCPGEAAEKQVAIIHVEERDFVLEPITLKTVRPFVMDDIDLDDAIEAAQVKIDEKQGVAKVLKKKIHELIARAEREWQEKNKDIPVKDRPEKMLPLVRLRVAHTRHDIGNIVRFGQDFVDKVANPRDLLQFHKKKATQASKKNSNIKENYLEPTDEMLPAERLEKVHMSDLVQTYLASQQLQILNPAGLERAVMNFVDKDDREAIGHFVEKEMKTTNLGLVAMAPDEKKLQEELNRIREEKMRLEEGEDEDEEVDQSGRREESTAKTAKATNGNSATSKRMLVDSDDSMLSDMEDDGFQENRRRPAPTAAKNGRSTAAASQSQRTPKMTQSTLMFRGNSDDEEDDDVSPPLRATASTSSRAAALSESTTKKKPPAKKATATTTKARGAAAGGRAAAKKASSRFVESQAGEDDDDDEDNYSIVISDDDGFEAPTKSKAKAKPATSRARR